MEIKRKKITTEEIFETEKRLAEEVQSICKENADAFEALGYEVDLLLQQKEDELARDYDALSLEEGKTYATGYVSRAYITIRRKEAEEASEAEEAPEAEEASEVEEASEDIALSEGEDTLTPEEEEQLANDETLRESTEQLKRTAAFTEVMLVRAYKSFWTEWVSLCDGCTEVQSDLAEFLTALREKAENE